MFLLVVSFTIPKHHAMAESTEEREAGVVLTACFSQQPRLFGASLQYKLMHDLLEDFGWKIEELQGTAVR